MKIFFLSFAFLSLSIPAIAGDLDSFFQNKIGFWSLPQDTQDDYYHLSVSRLAEDDAEFGAKSGDYMVSGEAQGKDENGDEFNAIIFSLYRIRNGSLFTVSQDSSGNELLEAVNVIAVSPGKLVVKYGSEGVFTVYSESIADGRLTLAGRTYERGADGKYKLVNQSKEVLVRR